MLKRKGSAVEPLQDEVADPSHSRASSVCITSKRASATWPSNNSVNRGTVAVTKRTFPVQLATHGQKALQINSCLIRRATSIGGFIASAANYRSRLRYCIQSDSIASQRGSPLYEADARHLPPTRGWSEWIGVPAKLS